MTDTDLRENIAMIIHLWMMPHVDYRVQDNALNDVNGAARNIIKMLKEKGLL